MCAHVHVDLRAVRKSLLQLETWIWFRSEPRKDTFVSAVSCLEHQGCYLCVGVMYIFKECVLQSGVLSK